jgi:hypothetical protein
LAFEEHYKDIGCQVCNVLSRTISGRGPLWSVRFVSAARQCHEHKMSATTNNFFFAKKEWSGKTRDVLDNVWLLSFEPGPDPNIICATRPSPGPYRPVLYGCYETENLHLSLDLTKCLLPWIDIVSVVLGILWGFIHITDVTIFPRVGCRRTCNSAFSCGL